MAGTFLNTLKFTVKDCDPNTGEPDVDVGYSDEYVVSNYNTELLSELGEDRQAVIDFST